MVLVHVLAVAAMLCASVPSASAFYGAPLDYLNACEGASSSPSGFADAGLAADCLQAYGIALGKADEISLSCLGWRLLTRLTSILVLPDCAINTMAMLLKFCRICFRSERRALNSS